MATPPDGDKFPIIFSAFGRENELIAFNLTGKLVTGEPIVDPVTRTSWRSTVDKSRIDWRCNDDGSCIVRTSNPRKNTNAGVTPLWLQEHDRNPAARLIPPPNAPSVKEAEMQATKAVVEDGGWRSIATNPFEIVVLPRTLNIPVESDTPPKLKSRELCKTL